MSGPAEDSRAYPWALKAGARVNRWRIVEPLGAGSYGSVYRVEAVDAPGVTYALKLALRPSDVRAEREVALLAATEHPHVVRVHDWGSWEGPAGSHLYFVMDWVQGLPLHTWAETANPPLHELARVASTLALTLDWLHERGVAHRDLKPEHILIRASDAQPILIDFGVGRQEGASTLTSTVVPPGTAHLRSPEAVDFHRLHYREEGARYTFRPTDDLYALGVCLFRALTGHYPFPPDLPVDLLMLAILVHVPLPVADINRRVPRGLSEVVTRMLEKNPEARHGSGRELHQALERARASGPEGAWEARVFAWEEGADPAVRSTVRPDWPTVPATPPQRTVSAGRRSTKGREVVGVLRIPASAVTDPAAYELAVLRLCGGVPPRPRANTAGRRRRVWRAALAVGTVMLVGLVAWLAARYRGASSKDAAAPSEQSRPRSMQGPSALEEAPPGRAAETGAATPSPLVESPLRADAVPMTQPKDLADVKTSQPSSPPAKTRAKTPGASRGVLGAAAAACVGAACASSPQPGAPARGPAALDKARPPPEECPPGALKAMEELQFGKVGDRAPLGSLVPYDTGPAPAREGPAVFTLDTPLGTLPPGTTVAGRLFFAEGRVHGWFTEARMWDGRRFPVCMVLLDEDRALGWAVEGAGGEPGTVLVWPLGKLWKVKRFE